MVYCVYSSEQFVCNYSGTSVQNQIMSFFWNQSLCVIILIRFLLTGIFLGVIYSFLIRPISPLLFFAGRSVNISQNHISFFYMVRCLSCWSRCLFSMLEKLSVLAVLFVLLLNVLYLSEVICWKIALQGLYMLQ